MHVDLHSHTTISDGVLSPEELVDHAAHKGVRFLAITDHDTTGGLARAFERGKRHPSLTIIPGVELSADVPEGEVHILGYLDSYEAPASRARWRDSVRDAWVGPRAWSKS